MIQSGEGLCNILGKLGKKVITHLSVLLARHNLSKLVSNLASNRINKFERTISWKGAVRAEKEFTLIISNEDMNDIFKIKKSLKDLSVLIDRVNEIVKYEIKESRARISWILVSAFSRFNNPDSDFFSSKRYTCKRN